jgi:hypothetical protein
LGGFGYLKVHITELSEPVADCTLVLYGALNNLKIYNMKTIQSSRVFAEFLKRHILFFSVCLFQAGNISGQVKGQVYDDFEGNRQIHYGERTGVLDSTAKNPAPNAVNGSGKCALYVRNGAKKFANIKMSLTQNMTGVESYATYEGVPPKLKMKVYTGAPAGTLVEVLLSNSKGANDYPAGVHSQYQAYTTKSNEWEELEFKFSQIPQGSETSASQIDQMVLLFNPNSSNSDTYYFDDLTGPPLAAGKDQQIVSPEKTDGKNIVGPEKTKTEKPVEAKKGSADKKTKPK